MAHGCSCSCSCRAPTRPYEALDADSVDLVVAHDPIDRDLKPTNHQAIAETNVDGTVVITFQGQNAIDMSIDREPADSHPDSPAVDEHSLDPPPTVVLESKGYWLVKVDHTIEESAAHESRRFGKYSGFVRHGVGRMKWIRRTLDQRGSFPRRSTAVGRRPGIRFPSD